MKTYVSNLIPRLQQFSERLDNLSLLIDKHWVVLDDQGKSKMIYIFRSNNELLISLNGKVSKAKWEYVGNNSILIDIKDESFLFRHGFFDENFLALKIDNANEYAFLVNENKFETELADIFNIESFLTKKYLAKNEQPKKIQETHISQVINNKFSYQTKNTLQVEKIFDPEKRKKIEKTDRIIGNIDWSILVSVTLFLGICSAILSFRINDSFGFWLFFILGGVMLWCCGRTIYFLISEKNKKK